MAEFIVTFFLGLSLYAYAITGGADFGAGILEVFAKKGERKAIRKAGEAAIAPVWEANHIWIVVALVILFVAFPAIHVRMTTHLHVPLVLMLVGIILRGTAFTFRYYDTAEDKDSDLVWTLLYRSGSLMVPLIFGHLAASMSRGLLLPEPGGVWESYMAPWLGLFPFATGVFTICLFAWVAAVFLIGEVSGDTRRAWVKRAKAWTIATLVSGGVVCATAAIEGPHWFTGIFDKPLALVSVALATLGVGVLWKLFAGDRVWFMRITSAGVVLWILAGYWGAVYPTAIELKDGTSIAWHDGLATEATLNALSGGLILAALLIVPGLVWLYRTFKRATHAED